MLDIHVLKGNKQQGIDNHTIPWMDVYSKVVEEAKEVAIEIDFLDKLQKIQDPSEHILEKIRFTQESAGLEALDSIQSNILVLQKLQQEGVNVENLFRMHNRKLIEERGWEPEERYILVKVPVFEYVPLGRVEFTDKEMEDMTEILRYSIAYKVLFGGRDHE